MSRRTPPAPTITPVFPTMLNTYIRYIANAIITIEKTTFATVPVLSDCVPDGEDSFTLGPPDCINNIPHHLQYFASMGLSVLHLLHLFTIILRFYVSYLF